MLLLVSVSVSLRRLVYLNEGEKACVLMCQQIVITQNLFRCLLM